VTRIRRSNSDRGATLTFLAFAMAVLLLTVAGYLMDASTRQVQLTNLRAKKLQAFTITEAGIEAAIHSLKADRIPLTTDMVGVGRYEVTIRREGTETRIIRSAGFVPDLEEAISPVLLVRVRVTGEREDRRVEMLSWEQRR